MLQPDSVLIQPGGTTVSPDAIAIKIEWIAYKHYQGLDFVELEGRI